MTGAPPPPRPATPHGFRADERGRLLWQRPPPSALRWVERTLGVTVRRLRAYKGGRSSAIHGLRVETPGGTLATVVLRRYVIPELNEEEPYLAEREARALRLLTRTAVPAPELLAVDESGSEVGVPTVLMSRCAGRLDWDPRAVGPWLRRLAEVLPTIHAAPITAADGVPDFAPYEPDSWEPPAWFADTRVWDRAVALFHAPPLDRERVFIHRDYHPGNVLWQRSRVTGVVDWQSASIGPRPVDVWHCRGNLIGRFGLDVADQFLDLWESITGATYHPWAEAVMLVDAIGWTGQARATGEQRALEHLLARRLAELGA